MRQRITKRTADAVEPTKKDQFLWDTEVKGFGLKVTPRAVRIYLVQYRFAGRLRRYTIGQHGSPWTAETARAEALRLLRELAGGIDPAEAKSAQKRDPSFAQFAERYLAEHAVLHKKPRSFAYDRDLLRLHILPVLGSRKLSVISRTDIARLHQAMASMSITANRALALIASMFRHAARWGLIAEGTNPCVTIKKYPEKSQERFLSEVELARLGEALAAAEAGLSPPAAIAAIRLLIVTGARKSEILNLRWDYVDFERALLRLPDSKTGAKSIYLNAPALEILAGVQRDTNPFVLAGKKHNAPLVNVEKTWCRVRSIAGLEGVRLHDLRHSFAAVGAGAGLGLQIIGKLLGHTQTSTTERYAHLAADPLRAANEAIGRRINAAMSGNRADIAAIRGAGS